MQRFPVGVHRIRAKAEYIFAGVSVRNGDEYGKAVEDHGTLRKRDSIQETEKGEGVARASVRDDQRKRAVILWVAVKCQNSGFECRRGVREVRCTGTKLRAGHGLSSRRDGNASQGGLKLHPARSDLHNPVAARFDVQ